MNLLPLVIRELRVAVRRPSSYRIRMGVASGAICISFWATLVWSGWTAGASLGLTILRGLATLGFVSALAAGVILAADCLSREVREATMGLLFLTGLSSRELVLGKLAAKILVPLYALIGMLPGFAVCSVLGGVTGGEFWRLLLVLANTLFFALGTGMLASSLCEQPRTAYGSAVLLILLSSAGIPFLGFGVASWTGNPVWADIAAVVSPTGSFGLAFDQRYASAASWFWCSFVVTHLMAWLCAGLSCRFVERRARADSEAREKKPRLPSQLTGGIQATAQSGHEFIQRSSNPIAWLAGRRRANALLIWILPAAAAGVLAGYDLNPLGNTRSRIGFLLWFALHLIFKVWLAGDAAHAFATDRRSGALELLLGTSLRIGEIAGGMLQAFRRRFLWPALAFFFLDVDLGLRFIVSGDGVAALMIGLGAALFLFDCYCVCWVGLWRGLVSLHSAVATGGSVWRTLLLPWLMGGMVAVLFPRSSPLELTIVWAVLNAVNGGVFLRGAKRYLHEHFRVMALRPYGEKAPHIESEWSPINWDPEPSHLDLGSSAPSSE